MAAQSPLSLERLRSALRPWVRWVRAGLVVVGTGPAGRLAQPMLAKLRQLGLVSTQNRFVLTIGDEGATLVKFRYDQVVDAVFVGPDSADGLQTLREYLVEDPQAQVLVAVDVLEQMYREEQLPRVSRWDRLSITKRRLEVAFPHDRLKAAVPLERGKGGAASYLFTALPMTRYIEQWATFLESLPNVVVGFCLLPLESEGLAMRLSPPAAEDGRKVWHALVSQQATSGFRQIFESDGNLVVTRLTQRPPGELTADAVALLIERELRSSISYIKRLGYSDADRLELVVLSSADICAAVRQRDLPISGLTTLTPHQAGQELDFGAVGPPDSPYADVLHAVNLASKSRPKTYLPTEKIDQRLKTEALFKASFVAAAMISLVAVLYVGSIIFDSIDTLTTAQTLARSVEAETRVLDALQQKTRSYEVPIEDLVAVDQTDETLKKSQLSPTSIMRLVAVALDPTALVQKIVYTAPIIPLLAVQAGPPSRGAARRPAEIVYDIQVAVRFPGESETQIDHAAMRARQIKDNLAKMFPGHEITLVKLPYSDLQNQVLAGSVGGRPMSAGAVAAVAEYLIRKRG